jgi:hypothetical protein
MPKDLARSRFALVRRLAVAALVVTTCGAELQAAPALKVQSGRLQDFLARLASRDYLLGDPAEDKRPYVEPGESLSAVRRVAQQIAWGDVNKAVRQADQIDCEVVEFTDEATDSVYYALRENRKRLDEIRGWGSYVFHPEGAVDALVEVPHPLADANTTEIGAQVFEQSDAKGFLLAGTHRDKADVPDLVDSAFHQVHMAWVGPFAQIAAWQIHGFEVGKHEFPQGVSVVASTGDGAVPPEIARLDSVLDSRGLSSYVFNDLAPESRINRRLNGGIPGVTFTSLAATKNEQGRHSRSLGGTFVHVELETTIRTHEDNRQLASHAIADALRRSIQKISPHDDDVHLASLVTSPPEPSPPPTVEERPNEEPSSASPAAETIAQTQAEEEPASSRERRTRARSASYVASP